MALPKPQPVELRALEQAGALLRFAAENTKEIPEKLSSAITNSWEARDQRKWTPEIATRFWDAYNALCALIKPVNIDTLITSTQIVNRRPWYYWGKPQATTEAKATAHKYINILLVTLLFSIALQFIVTTAVSLTTEINEIMAANEKIAEKLNQEIPLLVSAIGNGEISESTLTPDQLKLVSTIRNEFDKIWIEEDRIALKLNLFVNITALQTSIGWKPGSLQPNTSVAGFQDDIVQHYRNVRFFVEPLERSSIRIKILNSTILPLLLGIVGACAYVTRLISDQIKDSTFSSISQVRHHVRVVLGGLAGVVVGFGWIGTGISASPLAVAFIAGYSVEPVFATFDGIAEKFRKSAS